MSGGLSLSVRVANPEVFGKLQQLAVQFPNEVRRAQGRAASIVTRKIRSAVKGLGGTDTGRLPPLSQLRLALHPNSPPGGVLTEAGKALCRVQKRGNTLYAGYITGVEGVFSRWQDGGTITLESRARAQMHRMLAYGGQPDMQIPETSEQPERPVVEPIYGVATREYPRWVLGAALKAIDKTLRRAGA